MRDLAASPPPVYNQRFVVVYLRLHEEAPVFEQVIF
jgi:hypothetical protein